MSAIPLRAALYARISDDRENDERGVKRQLKDERALVATRGGLVVAEHVDNDISAFKGAPRPGYDALLAAAEAGDIDVIVIWQLSRLWRSRRERADGIDRLAKARVSVLACKGPDLDLQTAYGRGMAGLLGEFDTMESEVKGERIRRKVLELAEEGRIANGGPRPFGFRRIYAGEGNRRKIIRDDIDDDEAIIIREMADRLLAGESVRSVTNWLNDSAVPTSTGRRWSKQAVRLLMRGGRIAGLREHQRQVIGKAVWPAIITVEQHEQLRALLDSNERAPGSKVRLHYLSGFVFCTDCVTRNVKMRVGKQAGQLKYRCPPDDGCNGRVIGLANLENLVGLYLVGRLADDRFTAELTAREQVDDTDTTALVAKIDADERRLALLKASLDDGAEDEIPEVVASLRVIRRRIAEAREQLGKRAGIPGVVRNATGVTLEEFNGFTLDTRRAILGYFVEQITVGPALHGRSRFDPSRVDIVPRQARRTVSPSG